MNAPNLHDTALAMDLEMKAAFAQCAGFEWVAQSLMFYDMGIFTAEQALTSLRANAELPNPVLPSAANKPVKRDVHGFRLDASIIGGAYVPSGNALTPQDAEQLSAALMAANAPVLARLQALHDQIANLRQAVCFPSSVDPSPMCQGAPGPARPGGAPAPQTHCVAPSAPCAGLAPQQPVAPTPAKTCPDLSCPSPKVD